MGDIHGFREGKTPCRHCSAGTGRARMMSGGEEMLSLSLCGARILFGFRGSRAFEVLMARILQDGSHRDGGGVYPE